MALMKCTQCDREHDREGRDLCFPCHCKGIKFGFSGPVRAGKADWNTTAKDYKLEHFGTADDKALAAKGVVPAADYGW